MMIGAYSSPAHGYMSLDPIRDLGNDPVVALWRAGVRSGQGVPAAKGWAMLILGDGGPRAVRISARSAQDARRTAARELGGAEVVLLEGVYRGRMTVFRRTEILRAMSVGKAAGDDTVQLVGSSGVLIQKSLSPADPVDARLIAGRLAGQLRHQERLMFGPKLKAYMDKLNIDWANMDATATSRALAKIRTDMRAMVGPAARKLMPTWKITVESTVTKVFTATRKVVQDNFLPTVGLSLRQPDLVAVRTIADQQGWWMRNAAGVRSDQLTKKARGIVQQGLKDGLGRIEIASSLRTALPKAWQAMGARYFNAVASVAVSRGRSYSEVSGYIEVGIEALEVQAVLDERTTEVCRCLDGQIIDTHVVSQQIVGAMNVATPEDIKTASPFIRQVLNRETGVKSLVTTSGVKIADVVRSGMGRADDRGQFNRYRANNQLADANIGPPPYHHLCRSWTIPVTSTISVPRNKVPQAQGQAIPPVMRPKPSTGRRGSMPFMPSTRKPPKDLSQSRPIVGVPQGTPAHPALVGEDAAIDRMAFPGDYLEAQAPSSMLRTKIKYGPQVLREKDVALYRPYQADLTTGQIRASSKWTAIKKPPGGSRVVAEGRTYENISRDLQILADDVGYAVNVNALGAKVQRELILNESTGAAGSRVYNVKDLTGRKNTYFRFNHDKKELAKPWLKKLKNTDSPLEILSFIEEIEKTRFLQRSSKPNLWFGGTVPQPAAAPKITPRPKLKPKPTPKPKPKPRGAVFPAPKPKPAATTNYVTPTGQVIPKPKPKPKLVEDLHVIKPGKVTDYSQHGLIEGEHPWTQFSTRMQAETTRLIDAIATAEQKFIKRFGRSWNDKELGTHIREFIAADTGAVEKITAKMVRKNTLQASSEAAESGKWLANTELNNNVRNGSMRVINSGQPITLKAVPAEDAATLLSDAFKTLSQRVLDASLKKGLPNIYYAENIEAGAFYMEGSNALVIPKATGRISANIHTAFNHEHGHYIGTLGKSGTMDMNFIQEFQALDGIEHSTRGYKYYQGKWADFYTGRIYSQRGHSEVFSTTKEALSVGRERSLANIYRVNPSQVGHGAAQSKGDYIP